MCGINGILRFGSEVRRQEIAKMNKTLRHRGPDDEGCFVLAKPKYYLGLGHTRLSILDLSAKGHQPMGVQVLDNQKTKLITEDKDLKKADYIIVFNGEIYNFRQLAKELSVQGWSFESKTDTEVLLKGYIQYGQAVLDKLNGMWSFCIYDKAKDILFLSRDRLGVKPLFYFYNRQEFCFSSEIYPLLKVSSNKPAINKSALWDFATYNYIPAPKTLYQNIFKLEAGHCLVFNCQNNSLKIKKYWQLEFRQKESLDWQQLDNLLADAIKIRLKADVDVGILLSGGLDSQTLAFYLKNKGFDFSGLNLRFSAKDSDYQIAHRAAREFGYKVDFISLNSNESKSIELIKTLAKAYGEPFGDNSSIPTFLVMLRARQTGYKVLLTGDGGDELFFGYAKYRILYFLRIFNFFLPLKIRKAVFGKIWRFSLQTNLLPVNLKKILLLLSLSLPEQFIKLSGGYVDVEKQFIFSSDFLDEFNGYNSFWHFDKYYEQKLSFVKRLQKLDIGTYLPNYILKKVDTMSMLASVEVRSPLLDYRLYEYIAEIKSNQIFRGWKLKRILKKLMSKRLPKYILAKKKTGFGAKLQDHLLDKDNSYLLKNKKIYEHIVWSIFAKNILRKN